jgi:hypothetical protein
MCTPEFLRRCGREHRHVPQPRKKEKLVAVCCNHCRQGESAVSLCDFDLEGGRPNQTLGHVLAGRNDWGMDFGSGSTA